MRILAVFAACCLAVSAFGQTTREEMAADLNKTGGVYFAYPAVSADNTPAPKGFKPFHVSHYGRHGSRYLIGDRDYQWMADLLHKAADADALTPLGVDFMHRLDSLMVETLGRGGDPSPLGRRQHRAIASRMIANYPEVFADNASITARSTLVPRCILSMASFCESLKEKNPRLTIDMESSNRYMPYICHSTPESDAFKRDWKEAYRKFKEKNTRPDRVVSSIFKDSGFVDLYVNPGDFMWGIYWLASDAQNTDGKISNLLTNIIDTADAAIASGAPSAALRFGHDGNVVPLTSLMHLEGCDARIEKADDFYKGWCDWKVTPMAANVQLIFFRNPRQPGKVLVKILHNERETRIPVGTDMWPYYDWQDVRAYFKSQIKE